MVPYAWLRLPAGHGRLQLAQHLSQPGPLLTIARTVTGALRLQRALVHFGRPAGELHGEDPLAGVAALGSVVTALDSTTPPNNRANQPSSVSSITTRFWCPCVGGTMLPGGNRSNRIRQSQRGILPGYQLSKQTAEFSRLNSMPPWVGSILAVLSDARVISLAALLMALLSYRRTSRLTALQTRKIELELEEKEREKDRLEAAQDRADIRARIYDRGQHSHRIEIENASAAIAYEVDIEFLDEKAAGILPQGEREEKLPISRIDPGTTVSLLAALAAGRWPPFNIALTWRDPEGTERRKETMLYEP